MRADSYGTSQTLTIEHDQGPYGPLSNDTENPGPEERPESEFPVGEEGPITPDLTPGGKRRMVGDSEAPYDSILGSAAEPANAGRGIVPTDHQVHDADKTRVIKPEQEYKPPPQDSILDDLAQDPSQIMDLEQEQNSIRLTPDTMIANRFKVIKELGAGGMGAVYLVEDIKLQEKRALKVMLPRLVADTVAQQRFLTEIKVLQRLSNESIVRVHDLGVDEQRGLQFFTMEHLPGKTLHKYLHEQGRSLPPAEVIDIGQKLCRALMYAHGKTIHRDLKPANVMLDDNMNLTILDFGLAKLMTTAHLQMSNMVMGTFHYQSPEQRYDPTKVDRRTDLFSLGVILYEMLTGEIPQGNFEPPSKVVKGVPKKLDRIVMRCLQSKPERRYQSAGELYDDLENAKSGLGPFGLPFVGRRTKAPRPDETTPPSTPGSMTPQPYVRQKSNGWILPVALLAVVIVGAVVYMTRSTTPPTPVTPIEALRVKAHDLSDQVEVHETVRDTQGNLNRVRGNTALEKGDESYAAESMEDARVHYDNAIEQFGLALSVAEAEQKVSALRDEIQQELDDLADVTDQKALVLMQQADDARREAIRLVEDIEEPDYIEAAFLLEAADQIVDSIPEYLAMVPAKEHAEEIYPQLEQRVAALRDKDKPVYDRLRSTVDEVFALTTSAAEAELADDYQSALDIYRQVAAYPATLDERVTAIEMEQRDIVASARAPAETQLATLREYAAEGQDVAGATSQIEGLLQEAAEAETRGEFTRAQSILARAVESSDTQLARLQTEAEQAEKLQERVLLAKADLGTAIEELEELDANPAEDAKESYETFMTFRTEAETAEAAGDWEAASRSYELARREIENVTGAVNVAAGERLRDEAREKADQLRGEYAALEWDGDAPGAFETAMATFTEAEGADDPLAARRLYNDSGDGFSAAIAAVSEERAAIRLQNEERVRLARLEAEEAQKGIPQSVAGYVQSDLDALKASLAEAAKAVEAGDLDTSIALYATATNGFQEAREAGVRAAVDTELAKAEERRAAAQKTREAVIARAQDVAQARVEQGAAERSKADGLWQDAEANFDPDASDLEGLEKIVLASRRYTEADNAYKRTGELYEQKTQSELQAEREQRARQDATKGLQDLEGLNSPYASVNDLVARSRALVDEGNFQVALNTINDAKKQHTDLQRAAVNAQNLRTQAQQELAKYPADDAPRDAASYATYQAANTAFTEGESLRGQEKFGPAADSFQLAMNHSASALSAYQQERDAAAAALAARQAEDERAAAAAAATTETPAVVTPPAGGGSGDLAAAIAAAEAAQAKIENGPDRDRYSRLDRRKATNAMEKAASASSPAEQIALYNEARELYDKMKPQRSSTGGR